MSPTWTAWCYTPICPHSLFNRSVIFGADSHLAVNIPENIGKLYLSVDGETPLEVSTGDQLRFFAADRCARFIRLGAHDFYDILNQKIIETRQ